MKKLFLLIGILFIATRVYAATPVRAYTYSSGVVINPSEVTANEDAIFSWAATIISLASNTVTSLYIVDGAVTSADILDGTIASVDILDGTIASVDILDETITTSDILNGTIANVDISSTAAIDSIKITFPVNTCRAYLSVQQDNLSNSIATKVLLDTENFDVNNEFTSNRFTAKTAGYYLIFGSSNFTNVVADKMYETLIYVNGANQGYTDTHTSLVAAISSQVSTLIHLNVNDYVELYATSNAGVDTVGIMSGNGATYLAIQRLTN